MNGIDSLREAHIFSKAYKSLCEKVFEKRNISRFIVYSKELANASFWRVTYGFF